MDNNGANSFEIDATTGRVTAIGSVNAGVLYTITVKATDGGSFEDQR